MMVSRHTSVRARLARCRRGDLGLAPGRERIHRQDCTRPCLCHLRQHTLEDITTVRPVGNHITQDYLAAVEAAHTSRSPPARAGHQSRACRSATPCFTGQEAETVVQGVRRCRDGSAVTRCPAVAWPAWAHRTALASPLRRHKGLESRAGCRVRRFRDQTALASHSSFARTAPLLIRRITLLPRRQRRPPGTLRLFRCPRSHRRICPLAGKEGARGGAERPALTFSGSKGEKRERELSQ